MAAYRAGFYDVGGPYELPPPTFIEDEYYDPSTLCGFSIAFRSAANERAQARRRSKRVRASACTRASLPFPLSGAAIQWYETSAEAMPLPDGAFDVVLCQLGLQFVPDKKAALREMRRVLVPGGRVLVSVNSVAGWGSALPPRSISASARSSHVVFGALRSEFSLCLQE